jgi:hypothetical protein
LTGAGRYDLRLGLARKTSALAWAAPPGRVEVRGVPAVLRPAAIHRACHRAGSNAAVAPVVEDAPAIGHRSHGRPDRQTRHPIARDEPRHCRVGLAGETGSNYPVSEMLRSAAGQLAEHPPHSSTTPGRSPFRLELGDQVFVALVGVVADRTPTHPRSQRGGLADSRPVVDQFLSISRAWRRRRPGRLRPQADGSAAMAGERGQGCSRGAAAHGSGYLSQRMASIIRRADSRADRPDRSGGGEHEDRSTGALTVGSMFSGPSVTTTGRVESRAGDDEVIVSSNEGESQQGARQHPGIGCGGVTRKKVVHSSRRGSGLLPRGVRPCRQPGQHHDGHGSAEGGVGNHDRRDPENRRTRERISGKSHHDLGVCGTYRGLSGPAGPKAVPGERQRRVPRR